MRAERPEARPEDFHKSRKVTTEPSAGAPKKSLPAAGSRVHRITADGATRPRRDSFDRPSLSFLPLWAHHHQSRCGLRELASELKPLLKDEPPKTEPTGLPLLACSQRGACARSRARGRARAWLTPGAQHSASPASNAAARHALVPFPMQHAAVYRGFATHAPRRLVRHVDCQKGSVRWRAGRQDV